MDNHIISILQNFEKPDHIFLKDKECLICLESFDDIETNKIVKLPCKCSNSAYHISCIVKFIISGEDKNFCPHCKSIYEIPPQQIQAYGNQVVPYIIININQDAIYELKIKNYTHIIVIHIISNSIMNVTNIVAAKNSVEKNDNEELKALVLFYFFKLFFNYVILSYSKNNTTKIQDCLFCSYILQTVSFGLLIYSLTKIEKDYIFFILIFNNVSLSLCDLVYRVIIQYKMENSINALG
jgi:hypothetical protein